MAEEKEVAKSKAELIQEKAAKKAEKVAAKEAKRREKLIKKGIDPDDPDFEDDGGIGGRIAVFLATAIIIAIWLGILVGDQVGCGRLRIDGHVSDPQRCTLCK